MKAELGEPENLDGFDEIPEEDQERVRKAWEAGHVAEEDIPDTADKSKLLPGYVDPDAPEKPKKGGRKKVGHCSCSSGAEADGYTCRRRMMTRQTATLKRSLRRRPLPASLGRR